MPDQHPNRHGGLRRAGQSSIEKAARLIHERRVRQVPSARVYEVEGDHAVYRVIASPDGIFCPCEAREPLCSHVLAVAHLREQERIADLVAVHREAFNGNGNGNGSPEAVA